MRNIKKCCAVICAIALVFSSITAINYTAVAADYSGLTYLDIKDNQNTEFDQKLKGSKYAVAEGNVTLNPIQYQNVAFSELYIASTSWSADQLSAKLNGSDVTVEGAGLRIMNAATYLTKKYNELDVSWNGGSAKIIIYCPAIQGETTQTPGPTQGPTQPGPTQPGPTQIVTTQTPTGQPATDLPVKIRGFVANTTVGESTIYNAVNVGWASATDPADPYDPSITSYNLYIYNSVGQLISKICNATNGGTIGGLSKGSYTMAVSGVNSLGEGEQSEPAAVEVLGNILDYTYPTFVDGPKAPLGLNIITADPKVQPSPGNEKNAIEVAWAASNDPMNSAYDPSVTGYNIYIFDITNETGTPYRRVKVNGAGSNYVAIKSVSSGKYLVFLTTVDGNGRESAFSAPSVSLPSSVEIKGDKYDNAQPFDYPDQPNLPTGLVINTDAQYGITVAWAADYDMTGIRMNLFVDGVCVKSGMDIGYYENRLKTGTYTIEVKAQFTSNNVESFPLTMKNVSITGDPGLPTKTPAELADPNYHPYVPVTTAAPTTVAPTSAGPQPTTVGPQPTTVGPQPTTVGPQPTTVVPQPTTKAPQPTQPTSKVVPTTKQKPTTVFVLGKTKVKKATKKKSAKKAKITLKRVAGANRYKVKYATNKKFKKAKTKTFKKTKFTLKGLKKKKTYYIKAQAIRIEKRSGYVVTFTGKWSSRKKVKMK